MGESRGEPGLPELLTLLGSQALVLQPRREGGDSGGGDVDAAVKDLDPRWPLRLPAGWRLRQALNYDVTGWYWVLDGPDGLVALDTLEDDHGIGRYGFQTDDAAGTGDQAAATGVRAAYLTAKRLRKGIADDRQWAQIRELAAVAPDAYRASLAHVIGRKLARSLEHQLSDARGPDPKVWSSARRAQIRSRWSPLQLVRRLFPSIARIIRRALRPTGSFVVIVGPDGVGKSTLAAQLPEECRGLFRRTMHLHWRPGLLPRPGAAVGILEADHRKPHSRPPRGRITSIALLTYHWLDFLIGGYVRVWPVRARTGLVVAERWWWDILIDPGRYRLNVPPSLIRLMSKPLLKPDIVVLLEAPGDVVAQRSSELTADEMQRQSAGWNDLTARHHYSTIDASRSPRQVAGEARATIAASLEERTMRRLGAGWAGLPRRKEPRLLLPRDRRSARAATALYQPMTGRARLAWKALRAFTGIGGLRLLVRGEAPPHEVREAVGPYLEPHDTIAVARTNHPDRYLVAAINHGKVQFVAKVAASASGIDALSREVQALESIAGTLPPPLRSPKLLAHDPRCLVLEAVPWQLRSRPWILRTEVAGAIGEMFAAGQSGHATGPTHGDFAPWNLLQTDEGWVVVDWEEATTDGEILFDPFHYLVQGHALLGRPSAVEIRAALRGEGPLGEALAAYSDAAGADIKDFPRLFSSYLRSSEARVDGSTPDGRMALAARAALRSAIR